MMSLSEATADIASSRSTHSERSERWGDKEEQPNRRPEGVGDGDVPNLAGFETSEIHPKLDRQTKGRKLPSRRLYNRANAIEVLPRVRDE